MFLRSQSLSRIVAALGLALLAVNGAQQCRALCLVTDCRFVVAGSQDVIAQRLASQCCHSSGGAVASLRFRVGDEAIVISHSSHECPGSAPCTYCDSPAAVKSASLADWQGAVDLLSMGECWVASQTPPNCVADDTSRLQQHAIIGTLDLCVKHCRLVV